jgi:hypothetical protein
MDKSISDSSKCVGCEVLSSSSGSLYSRPLSWEVERDPGFDLNPSRFGEANSGSLPEPPGDLLFLLRSFLVLDLDLEADLPPPSPPPKKDSSSTVDIVVATVIVEFERVENFVRLSSAVAVVWVIVDDLLTDDLDRLEPLTDPPNKSPFAEPGRAPKRFREMASKLNIWARERMLVVGVGGAEVLPVRNLNRPN